MGPYWWTGRSSCDGGGVRRAREKRGRENAVDERRFPNRRDDKETNEKERRKRGVVAQVVDAN